MTEDRGNDARGMAGLDVGASGKRRSRRSSDAIKPWMTRVARGPKRRASLIGSPDGSRQRRPLASERTRNDLLAQRQSTVKVGARTVIANDQEKTSGSNLSNATQQISVKMIPATTLHGPAKGKYRLGCRNNSLTSDMSVKTTGSRSATRFTWSTNANPPNS